VEMLLLMARKMRMFLLHQETELSLKNIPGPKLFTKLMLTFGYLKDSTRRNLALKLSLIPSLLGSKVKPQY
jgi:hypothetical protein